MKTLMKVAAAVALLLLLVPSGAALAQGQKVEVREGEVLRVLGGGTLVVIRNSATGEIKKFTEVPPNATLYIDGKPAKFSDLRQGMKVKAIRMENVPEPVTITEAELAAIPEEPVAAPAAKPAPAPAPVPAPAPAPAAAPAAAPAELPHTASNVPAAGLAGLALLLAGVAIGGFRRRKG